MKILFIEPYYGGSHKAFTDGYMRHSRHDIYLLSMPARKWKWRMRGASIWLADRLPQFSPDLLIASDYLDLATFRALIPREFASVPCAVYFHENQLTYPVDSHTWRDYQFALTNMTSCLAADRVFFNSGYHLESFLGALDALLRKMPDYVLKHVPQKIRDQSQVIPVGLETETIDRIIKNPRSVSERGPLHIIWNHRWEFDKNPDEFLRAVRELEASGAEFELSVMGESFRKVPEAFESIREELPHRIRHFGYVEGRQEYIERLCAGDVLVSTAIHEFFGIAVLEAVYAGCVPLLPNRLSYPELIPAHLHPECLYNSFGELVSRLKKYAQHPGDVRKRSYNHIAAQYNWHRVAAMLDDGIEKTA